MCKAFRIALLLHFADGLGNIQFVRRVSRLQPGLQLLDLRRAFGGGLLQCACQPRFGQLRGGFLGLLLLRQLAGQFVALFFGGVVSFPFFPFSVSKKYGFSVK